MGEKLGPQVVSEKTIFRSLDLPSGRDWAWYGDLNVVALRRGLDGDGKRRALAELVEHWHLEHVGSVELV